MEVEMTNLNTTDLSRSLASLAVAHPAATEVFLNHGFDFCCGGDRLLADACRSAGVEPERVMAEIDEVEGSRTEPATRWDHRPLPELIDFIVTQFHRPLRTTLPGLIVAARTVERVHGPKPTCPIGLADHLEAVKAAVDDHLDKEERVLFPLILSGRGRQAMMPVRVMVQEHEDHGANLRRIRALTFDLTVPSEACETWRGLYRSLERLEAELMEHIHLENNILFPRALIE
jgi:regulator of cell morphogenesis and NO signaling